MLTHDLILLAWTYFILFLLQLLSLPIIFYLSEKFTYLKDAGWGFARLLSILFLSLIIWNVAFLQIPINTTLGVSVLFFSLSLISLFLSWTYFLSKQGFMSKFVNKFGKIILIEELVFLLAFTFLSVTRSFQSEILGLEKFMDAGFIQAYLKSSTLPAQDMWFAGSSINYYSFGHFYNSILVNLWQIDLSYGYNLLLISLFAIFCVELFSLAFNLRANLTSTFNFKPAVFSGILAIFLVALGANGHTIWYLLSHIGFDGYWYPDATRFIERTIHEFPAYSFVVCDLHAHVLSLPISLFLLMTTFVWLWELLALRNFKFQKLLLCLSLLMGALFGVLVMTNTWDVLIYGLLLVIISLFVLVRNWKLFWPIFWSAICIAIGTVTFSAFWFLNFTPISSGLAIAREHTPLWQLAVLWGPHLFWALLLMFLIRPFLILKKNGATAAVLTVSLFLLILVLIIFPEFFYFRDIYTTYPRANTMFKLVFQGFTLLGILLSLFFSLVLFDKDQKHGFFAWRVIDLRQLFVSKKRKLFLLKVKARRFFLLILPIGFFLFFSTLAYPYLAYRSYYNGLKTYQGLDGLAWFRDKYPDDFLLLEFLKKNEKKQVNIVEAVGESYTEFARISAFSGMSTILGWRVHEWLWRAGWDEPSRRTSEVEKIYNEPTSDEAKEILVKYDIKYIVIGDKEYEAYPKMQVEELLKLGEVAVSSGRSFLVRVD